MLSPLTGNLSPLGASRRGGDAAWVNYIASLSPLLWYRFNESTSTLVNYGSVAGSNGSQVGTITQGVTGQLGAGNAYTFPTTTRIDIPYQAGWGDILSLGWLFLLKPNAPPTAASNRYLGRDVGYFVVRRPTTFFITAIMRNSVATQFTTNASNQGLADGAYKLLGFNYNDSTDRIPHIYVNGVECNYSLQQAVTGTIQFPTNGMTFADNQTLTLPGLVDFDEAILLGRAWTTSEMLQATSIAGL